MLINLSLSDTLLVALQGAQYAREDARFSAASCMLLSVLCSSAQIIIISIASASAVAGVLGSAS